MAFADDSVRVKGLRELQSSLRKAEGDTDKMLKRDLRKLGNTVKDDAKANAPVGPRPKRSNTPPLAGSLRVSVTNRGVSIFSAAAHAYVQDRGGKVGRGAVIPRSSASGYLTKAAAQNRVRIDTELRQLVDRIADEIHT